VRLGRLSVRPPLSMSNLMRAKCDDDDNNSGDECYLVSLGLSDMWSDAARVEFGERDTFDE
jgi:hypothetical protein